MEITMEYDEIIIKVPVVDRIEKGKNYPIEVMVALVGTTKDPCPAAKATTYIKINHKEMKALYDITINKTAEWHKEEK